jgi:hypothetical protein
MILWREGQGQHTLCDKDICVSLTCKTMLRSQRMGVLTTCCKREGCQGDQLHGNTLLR